MAGVHDVTCTLPVIQVHDNPNLEARAALWEGMGRGLPRSIPKTGANRREKRALMQNL
ncbi:hypothetical protein TEQG_05427 [Trichophyton equinum CBS 127.97]|uniref:Uncharacterized protein n=1 Tax=Trichophyton equinum (strain ATCC MYA-4606 / CBS 127.97) TaxID=559882 RepID=F2PX05_TRIEC|nr:hypothetical protein TEQG_05427 [Trichophyton equinum CBS 127.97]